MRNIFNEIFARYLNSDQHAFETTSRELWPSKQFEFQVQIGRGAGFAADPSKRRADCSELESQN